MGIVKAKDRGRASKRRLKEDATRAERQLMAALNKAREPYSFQYVVQTEENDAGFYVVDLFLPRRRLLVEIDGGPHFTSRGHWRDRLRTEAINRARPDLSLVRFCNGDVEKDPAALARFLRSF